MPKIIKDPKEKILKVSIKELETKGYEKLSMREVAKKSGIGLGTIYNYFDDKLSIIAEIVSIEWNKSLNELNNSLNEVTSIEEGIGLIYQTIHDFWSTHKEFLTSIQVKNLATYLGKGHAILISRTSKIIKGLYLNLNREVKEPDLILLTNIVISSSTADNIDVNDLINFLKHFVLEGGNNE